MYLYGLLQISGAVTVLTFLYYKSKSGSFFILFTQSSKSIWRKQQKYKYKFEECFLSPKNINQSVSSRSWHDGIDLMYTTFTNITDIGISSCCCCFTHSIWKKMSDWSNLCLKRYWNDIKFVQQIKIKTEYSRKETWSTIVMHAIVIIKWNLSTVNITGFFRMQLRQCTEFIELLQKEPSQNDNWCEN